MVGATNSETSAESRSAESFLTRRRRIIWPAIALVVIFALLIYTQITIFVVQPIGAVPEGRTLVMLRLNKTEFIDSADGMCERIQHSVSLMCRLTAMGAVAKNGTILFRLPYSETLYLVSTGGKKYER